MSVESDYAKGRRSAWADRECLIREGLGRADEVYDLDLGTLCELADMVRRGWEKEADHA